MASKIEFEILSNEQEINTFLKNEKFFNRKKNLNTRKLIITVLLLVICTALVLLEPVLNIPIIDFLSTSFTQCITILLIILVLDIFQRLFYYLIEYPYRGEIQKEVHNSADATSTMNIEQVKAVNIKVGKTNVLVEKRYNMLKYIGIILSVIHYILMIIVLFYFISGILKFYNYFEIKFIEDILSFNYWDKIFKKY